MSMKSFYVLLYLLVFYPMGYAKKRSRSLRFTSRHAHRPANGELRHDFGMMTFPCTKLVPVVVLLPRHGCLGIVIDESGGCDGFNT
jgi:hypothetical protein